MQSAARSYFQTQVTTTTQGDLLIMLFDGALKFLSQAREQLLAKDCAKKGILISKALDILTELQGTLNPERGGKLAERLRLLYLYCSTRLLRANLNMDVGALDETVRILTGVRDAFAEANSRVETRAVEATSSQSLAPRIVPTAPNLNGGAAMGSLGAAAYARVGATPVVPGSRPAAVETKTPAPVVEAPRMSASDGLSLEEAHAIMQQAPPAPQAVVVQAVAPPVSGARSVTDITRAMAAYSTRTTR
jgi:flagellar secretion chaperone FliS